MRRPRDYDAELKALTDKAKLLKDRKILQLGEVVIATGADLVPVEVLAGALLAVAETKDKARMEVWRERGAAFFQGTSSRARSGSRRDDQSGQQIDSGAPSS